MSTPAGPPQRGPRPPEWDGPDALLTLLIIIAVVILFA